VTLLLGFGVFAGLLILMVARAFFAWAELPQTPPQFPAELRPGLWFCSHRARRAFKYQHLFIKITPSDPSWEQKYPALFKTRDAAGKAYATLGAGPKEGKLALEFNRSFDLKDPVSFEAPCLSKDIEEENRRIEALLRASDTYQNQLPFNAWGPFTGPGYNCNSMMSALADQAKMPRPRFAFRFMLCPGIFRPVPKRYVLK
jgi:hypothetical protein